MRIVLLGDLILDEEDPDALFEPSRELLCSADLVVGQVEVPHSRRGSVQSTDVPARPSDPDNLAALERIGLDVATLAGNHIADAGRDGIEDTLEGLHALGIATAGAGMSLDEARRPALADVGGRTVGVLSFNCVGPRDGWARPSKPGCAYVEVLTHYELEHAGPGGPPRIYTFATPESLCAMRDDIVALREQADVVVVALHKGIGHVRARLAQYERDVAHAAIDCGRRHRGRPPRAHSPRRRGLPRPPDLPRARQLHNRDASATRSTTRRRQRRPSGRGGASSCSASPPTPPCRPTRSTPRAGTR